MALPYHFLQELKARNDLLDYAQTYVNMKRTGRSYCGLCPFHNERTPSFHVYPDGGTFYCFGCHQGGDVITFAMKAENLDYIEAVRLLADRAGLQVPESASYNAAGDIKNRIREINREAGRFYHSCLMSEDGKEALGYLQRRGLKLSTIRRFGLGYSPATKFALCNHLLDKGYKKEELIKANVAFVSRSGALIDRFINRVMFPIIDLRGNVIGFGGRIMTDEKPKYLNTSDTPVFSKSLNLFAMNFAKDSKDDCIILCEGYMDVIALNQAGFKNAVATLGTSLTTEQAMLISKYTNDVVICYDNDEAGRRASRRAIDILRKTDMKIRVLDIPGSKDPDEFIKSYGDDGVARFKQLLTSSANDVSYRFAHLREQFNTDIPEGKSAYANEAAAVIAGLNDDIERDVYISKLADETGISKDAIKQSVKRLRDRKYRDRQKHEMREYSKHAVGLGDRVNPDKSKNLRSANAEEGIIAYLLKVPSVKMTEKLREELSQEDFATEFCGLVYSRIMNIIMAEGTCDVTMLSGELGREELSSVAGITARYGEYTINDEDVERFVQIIKNEGLGRKALQNNNNNDDIQTYLESLRSQKK